MLDLTNGEEAPYRNAFPCAAAHSRSPPAGALAPDRRLRRLGTL